MTSLTETTVRGDEAALLEDKIQAALASTRVGLTADQFDRLLKAIEGRGGLLADLHKLSDKQQVVIGAYRKIELAMGIDGAKPILVHPDRDGREVAVPMPEGTDKVRVFFKSSFVTVDAGCDRDRFWLPECGADDRITRLEFLNERGVVLGVAGGESRATRRK